jgi:phosphoribosylformimino-5-aminoimidazole carboxamide ribotide isomerase
MLIIPAIDLKNGRCVRLKQGRKDAVTVYGDDPVAIARQFTADGAALIHVVDLDAAFGNDNAANHDALKRILREGNIAVQFGGGVRNAEDIKRLIDLGVTRIVLGTVAAESPDKLKELVDQFGASVCVAIDARNGTVMTRGWETASGLSAIELAKQAAEVGIERIIYTDTTRDGMLSGPNIDQTTALARAACVTVTASGGISSLDDIVLLKEAAEPLLDSVIVGKALYEGKFSLADAQRVCDSLPNPI